MIRDRVDIDCFIVELLRRFVSMSQVTQSAFHCLDLKFMSGVLAAGEAGCAENEQLRVFARTAEGSVAFHFSRHELGFAMAVDKAHINDVGTLLGTLATIEARYSDQSGRLPGEDADG
jgi:hypothetical protein